MKEPLGNYIVLVKVSFTKELSLLCISMLLLTSSINIRLHYHYVKPTNSSATTITFQYDINSIAITPFISYYLHSIKTINMRINMGIVIISNTITVSILPYF